MSGQRPTRHKLASSTDGPKLMQTALSQVGETQCISVFILTPSSFPTVTYV
jgi:hypothetical protein